MDTDQFLIELLKAVNSNTQIISELRRVIDSLPKRSEFKDSEILCNRVDANVDNIKDIAEKITARLDKIDMWQKIRLPFVIGLITLVLYSIGFFFTMHKVTEMINAKQPVAVTAPLTP